MSNDNPDHFHRRDSAEQGSIIQIPELSALPADTGRTLVFSLLESILALVNLDLL